MDSRTYPMVMKTGAIVERPTLVVKLWISQAWNLQAYEMISAMKATLRTKLKGTQRCVFHEMRKHPSKLIEIRPRKKALATLLDWLL